MPEESVYRCTDCDVRFHKACAQNHFKKSEQNYIALAKEKSALEAEYLFVNKKLDEVQSEVKLARQRLTPAGWRALTDKLQDLDMVNCPIHDSFEKKCRTCWQVSADWNVPANE